MRRSVFLVGGVVAVLVTATLYGTGRTPHTQNLSTSQARAPHNPIANRVKNHLDHSAFFKKPIESPEALTKQCLSCHQEQGTDMLKSAHFLWLSGDVMRDGKLVRTGKRNLMNNFCISVIGNEVSCSRCHAGYGMNEKGFDFTKVESVDCVVCHDGSGTYAKDKQGYPAASVNLATVAGSVRAPARENCGTCHFNGGGGMGVKHGDLDDSLINASEEVDVHMGRVGLQCVDCHKTKHHQIPGKINATYTDATEVRRFDCNDCHSKTPHEDSQLNKHVARVACQTCHIPSFARKYATKMEWDWSQAGDAKRKENAHEYLKIKGSFEYDESVPPVYAWFNGKMDRYVTGDKLTSDDEAFINKPLGSRQDATARIFPFKLHRAKQIYDPVNKVLIPPLTSGEGGYWTTFDWKTAAEKGMQAAGLPYSGQYGFIKTSMYWPINHMTAPVKRAVSCNECHSTEGRMDWKALGYERDPVGGQAHGS